MTILAAHGASVFVLHPHDVIAQHDAGCRLARRVLLEWANVAIVTFDAERGLPPSHHLDYLLARHALKQLDVFRLLLSLSICRGALLLARLGRLLSRRLLG